ncbi:MAG: glycosyltransferase family 4 protein [Gammaproteobacteria bacterium]|nr:glycosyltransferase family 4 protein [Gammaproteobacteria bacterium]MYG67126.1 glycosyltransferase family 4 protein [Gammaproteobacteria bacterium]
MQDHVPNMKDHNKPKLAFYAPMKSPDSPRPSGDRTIGALLVKALTAAGFEVEIASDFRSWEGRGDSRAQEKIRIRGEKTASDLVNGYRADCPRNRPAAWFSYHLYHKSPDWIGPAVSRELDIPYFCAEASVSTRQMDGPWGAGFTASIEAIRLARKIFNLNPRDLPALSAVDGVRDRIVPLLPFLDAETPDPASRNVRRQRLASRLRIDSDRYWLLCVAMMRDDAKLASYAQLARVSERMQRKDWMLLIVGDGAAELQVRDYFRLDKDLQIHFLGRRDSEFVLQLMSVSDLLVWPAINEAIGMTALEALAMGLPAVCGRSGGIGQIIHHGHTGLLVDDPETPDSVDLFAESIESLLGCPGRLAKMSSESNRRFEQFHRISTAARTLRDHMLPFI